MAASPPAVAGQAITAATMNRYLFAGGSKTQVKALWARVRYNGSAWEVHTTTDSAEITALTVAYSTDHINITIAGYTVAPVVIASPILGDTIYWPKAYAVSTTQIQVGFYNDAGTRQTSQSTNMDCNLIVLGV